MNKLASTLFLSLCFAATACDSGSDDSGTNEEGQAVDEGKSDSPANFPTDFPDNDTHCNGTFSNCDAAEAFSSSRWGSLGGAIDEAYRDGDQVVVRAFIEGDDLSGVRARLHFATEQVSGLDEAEQLSIAQVTGTRTRFDDGMEVQVRADIRDFMVDGGSVRGFFYVGFSGTDGTLRAIDVELD